MIRPLILLTLGLTLALGCGRSDRPTVRQTSMEPRDEGGPTTASDSSQAPQECPGSSLPSRTRPKRDELRAKARLVDAVHAKPTETREVKRPEGKPAAAGDTKTAATTVAAAAKSAATKPASAGGDAPPKGAGLDVAKVDSKEVRLGTVRLVAPKTWMRERPPISFILAQFSLPRAAGDKSDAQLTVTAPGEHDPRALERVREQFKEKPEEGSVEHLQIAGNEVVLVDSTGDYDEDDEEDEDDPSSTPANEGRYRSLNAMVFLDGKVYVVNCTGPEKTVGQRAGEFRAFLQTMKSSEQP